MLRPNRLWAAAVLASLAFLVGWLRVSHSDLLSWDEVDYVKAGNLGVPSNAFGVGSLTPAEFARFAGHRLSGARGGLPPAYDPDLDPLLLRHYHPPFVIYLTALLCPEGSPGRERRARVGQSVGAVALLVLLLYAYQRWDLGSANAPGAGALSLVVLATWAGAVLFRELHFHGWFAVWVLVTCVALTWGDGPGHSRSQMVSGLALGAATATLESALLFCVLLVCHRPARRWKFFAWAGVAALALWPAILSRAALVQIAALYGYRIWRGEEYAPVWQRLSVHIWTLFPLLLASSVGLLWALRHWRVSPAARLCVVAGLGYTAMLTPFALAPVYLMPGLLLLIPWAGQAIASLSMREGRLAVSLVTLVCLLGWPHTGMPEDVERRMDLAWLEASFRSRPNRRILADGGHVLRFYLPEISDQLESVHVAAGGTALLTHGHEGYRPLGPEDLAGALVLVRAEYAPTVVLLRACRALPARKVVLFDCPSSSRTPPTAPATS